MKIKATYIEEDQTYLILADEQTLIIPNEFMSKFVSAVEVAYSRQRHARIQAARKTVEEAHHPDVLPFTQERPQRKPVGRPPGIRFTAPLSERLKRSKPKKQKPVENTEFHHTKYR